MNKKQAEKLGKMLKSVSPMPKLPLPVFSAILRLAPHVVVELLITNSKKQIFLTWREDSPFYGWHVPGGFLGYGESVEKAVKRIIKKELNVKVASFKYLETLNYIKGEDPRAHLVALVCLVKLSGKPSEGAYFSSAPTPRAPHVVPLLKVLRKHS